MLRLEGPGREGCLTAHTWRKVHAKRVPSHAAPPFESWSNAPRRKIHNLSIALASCPDPMRVHLIRLPPRRRANNPLPSRARMAAHGRAIDAETLRQGRFGGESGSDRQHSIQNALARAIALQLSLLTHGLDLGNPYGDWVACVID